MYLRPFQESWEVEAVCNATACHKVNHGVHHISVSSHHKTYVLCSCKNTACSLHKVFRAFLHCYTAKECNQFVLAWGLLEVLNVWHWIHGVMNCCHFIGVLSVFLNYRIAGEVAHTYNMVCNIHTAPLYAVYRRVHVTAAAVKVCGVNVDYERLA